MDTPTKSRIFGSLIGYGLGDAWGASYEFQRRPGFKVANKFKPGVFGTRPGQGTDDSALARCAAKALRTGAEGDDLRKAYAKELIAWLKGGVEDIGNQTSRAIRSWMAGNDPLLDPSLGVAQSNGGLFVSHVAACFNRPGVATLLTSATHPNLRVLAYSSDFAALVHNAIDYGPLASGLFNHVQAATEKDLAAPWKHEIGYVGKAYQIAVMAAQMTTGPEDAIDALRWVIALGGDTDTNGAIAGGLLGAMWGVGAWKNTAPQVTDMEDWDFWFDITNEIEMGGFWA